MPELLKKDYVEIPPQILCAVEYCRQPAPESVHALIGHRDQRTNLHFLGWLIYEAHDILDRGDSIVRPIPFSHEDWDCYLSGVGVLEGISKSKNVTSDQINQVFELPNAMVSLAKYYEQKISLSRDAIAVTAREKTIRKMEFEGLLKTRDIKGLLNYILPYVEDEDPEEMIKTPEGRQILEMQLEEDICDWEDRAAIFSPFGSFFPSEKLNALDSKIACLERNISRNSKVFSALQKVYSEFERILNVPILSGLCPVPRLKSSPSL